MECIHTRRVSPRAEPEQGEHHQHGQAKGDSKAYDDLREEATPSAAR